MPSSTPAFAAHAPLRPIGAKATHCISISNLNRDSSVYGRTHGWASRVGHRRRQTHAPGDFSHLRRQHDLRDSQLPSSSFVDNLFLLSHQGNLDNIYAMNIAQPTTSDSQELNASMSQRARLSKSQACNRPKVGKIAQKTAVLSFKSQQQEEDIAPDATPQSRPKTTQ